MKDCKNEAEKTDQVIKWLCDHFYFDLEVWGTGIDGRRRRIDAIITPFDTEQWARPDIKFGVEIKRPGEQLNLSGMVNLVSQSIAYSMTNWDGYGKLPILMCSLEFDPTYCNSNGEMVIRHLLTKYNVGDLRYRTYMKTWEIVFGSERIWTLNQGTTGHGKRWMFKNEA